MRSVVDVAARGIAHEEPAVDRGEAGVSDEWPTLIGVRNVPEECR